MSVKRCSRSAQFTECRQEDLGVITVKGCRQTEYIKDMIIPSGWAMASAVGKDSSTIKRAIYVE